MALSAAAMYFVFRGDGRRDLVLSAVFSLLAFLTRYNGAFTAMGAMVWLALGGSFTARERLRRAGLWLGVFIAVGLPWFVPNFLATGNPVHNDNYINVMLEYYGSGKEGVTYENWTDALPKDFTGMGDIILYDPVYFARHTIENAASHFMADMRDLVGWKTGIFVVLGLLAAPFSGAGKRKWLFLAFGAFYFLILTIVFYNVRFSLFLLTVYLPFAVWPFTSERARNLAGAAAIVPAVLFAVVTLVSGVSSARQVYAEIVHPPEYLESLRDLGQALGRVEPDHSKVIIGRKPHVAYFAELEARMFPVEAGSVSELVEYCRENGVDYVLYTGIEAGSRPGARDLLNLGVEHPGLERVYYNRFGVIYRVTGEPSG